MIFKSWTVWIATAIGFGCILLAARFGSQNRQATVSLDRKIVYQTMTGWEALIQSEGADHPSFSIFKNEVIDRAIEELGINRIRIEIKSGIENSEDYFKHFHGSGVPEKLRPARWYDIVNDNDDPNAIRPEGFHFSELDFLVEELVIQLRKRLQARKENLFLNLSYVDFKRSKFEHKENPQEYAELVLATYQHLQEKYGFVPDSWDVILEPDNSEWSAEQIAQVILASADRLKSAGFTPRFIAPSTASMSRAVTYFDRMMKFPGLVPFLVEISYHRYSGVSDLALKQIAERAVQFRLNTAMSEHIGSGYKDLHEDLKTGRNSAWQQYTLFYLGTRDRGGKHYAIDLAKPSNPKVILGKRSKYFTQYFPFVRASAVRIHADSTDQNFDPLAFVNTDGRTVVIIKVNKGGSFSVIGLPPGRYGIRYATGTQFRVDLKDVTVQEEGSLHSGLPDSGVLTIYAKT
jgi:hypothetical protein